MKKILLTGNTGYGLAAAIKNILEEENIIDTVSRSNGYDLTKEDIINTVALNSLNYDIFINNSALYHFYQTWLFDTVWKTWKNSNKSGYIINIGSTTDRTTKGSEWIYQIEKKSLREISNTRSLLSVWGETNIRVTYISFGSLNTPKVIDKHPERILLDTEKAAYYIKWLIDQPEHININEISIDAIQ